MKFTTELEIFRNGILSGEINDVMWRLKRDIAIAGSIPGNSGKLMKAAFAELEEILSGKTLPAGFLASFTEREKFELFGDTRELEDRINLYRFDLRYCLDRYNVRYPEFNGKRCEDL